MSDRFGLKVKESAGKTKYSSLNLNQTYKGTKVETKTSSGTARHGLQSLGKVGASRRIPPPANLPSLKSENSGNDPTVSLVPSGGGGWGSAKEKPSETTPAAASQAIPPSSTPSQTNVPSSQQPLLQPQRPIPPPSHPQPVQTQSQSSGQTQNQPAKQQESQAKTWGTVSSNEAGGQGRSYSHQEMPYFNREFPVLGGGNSGERPPQPSEIKEQPPTQYGQKQIMRNTHEPPWMERSGPGPPPSDYGTGRERTEAYNGGPGYGAGHQYRRPPPDYVHGPHGRNVPQGHPHHHGNGPQSYGQGRHPHGYPPDHFSRGPGQRMGAPSGPVSGSKQGDKTRGEGYGRPSILKPEDIQAMADNDEEEEGGWAGAQDEVDYAAKLDFEDFEDDDKPPLEPPAKPEKETASGEPETRWQGNESRPAKGMGPPPTRPAWTESSGQVYSENRQVPPSPGMRPFDSRGSPPTPGWPLPYPQHIAGQPRGGHPPGHPPPPLVSSDQVKSVSKSEEPVTNEWQKRRVKQQEEMRAAVERARKRREEEEMRRQAEQKAGATAKLKELELKRVRRESAKEGDDAWLEELDSIEKDSYVKGPYPEQQMPETPEREVEPQNLALPQQDDSHSRNDFLEHVSHRQRNDSESSDGSRSIARGGSRPHHHTPRDIPPRFQQQQLRQQQHYQQQQPYPPQHPYHQQQMARSPQHREFPEGPLSVANHSIVDSGPVSPSQPIKPDQPVKRIMKRSDSSSTAGDDIASVKSLESASGETSREVEKKQHAAPVDKAVKPDTREEKTKESTSEATRKESNRMERKPDDQDLPVFDDSGSVGAGDTSEKRKPDSVLPQGSGKQDLNNKENDVPKERVYDKRERKDDESTSKPVSEKSSRFRDRRDEKRSSSKRETRTQDNRGFDDSKDSGKRKREESEDAERFTERRGRFVGRGGDPKRERFSESRGRGRVTFPVRGHGRGVAATATNYRGRGRGERGNRDNREYKEHKPTRSREPKPSPAWKTAKDDQKRNEEDKENVVVKEDTNTFASDGDKKVIHDSTEEKQDKRIESVPSTDKKEANKPEKGNEVTVTEVKKNHENDSMIRERKFEEEAKLTDKDSDKVKGSDDVNKKAESLKDVNNLKPKVRGGFGRPSQSSQDSRNVNNQDRREGGRKVNDRRRPTQEGGRDRKTDSDNYDKRVGRNYSRDNTNQRQTGRDNRYKERGQERDQKFHYQRDDRDTGNKRYSQDDRKKRFDDKDDDQQVFRRKGDERNQRGGSRSYSTRGRVTTTPMRTNARGGRSSQPVGSGRFGNNYRRVKSSEEELSDDDYDSDSSSYTTATSASEERRDEKPSSADKENDVKREKERSSGFDKSKANSRPARSPIRGKMSSRAGRRGTGGGFGRSRREVERPPRFQKQQEKERASMGRGVPQGVRTNEGRESGPGRGRGRGRGRREQPQREDGLRIPATEDWDEEVNEAHKETESSRNDKTGGRRESAPRRGFSGPRSSSERGRKDKSREAGGTRGNSSRREPFLAERQQAKVEGSKSVGGEPRGHLPAARNGFSKDGNRRSDMHSTGLDSINTGVTDSKTPKKQETLVRKTDIQQYDLHNIAGVICIDDMTDDDSDISSTLSGFVEVTSRRTQKENKDRQREEEERRKKVDEQNRQRGNVGNKKNQPSKPPRFSKQHTSQVNSQGKSGVIGKVSSTAVTETAIGSAITGSNSNPSSANSTKRNSPVNVERPVSPPPPVFNAWDKPLLLTPAKPPSTSPPVTSSIPDPLAVGSGKPSSTRVVQPQGTVISSAASLIEDISVDDDYIAMTKEIALLAPPEEPEESEEPPHITQNTKVEKRDQTTEKGAKVVGPSEKRSQAKPQRDKPPRFDRSGKRKAVSGAEETRKELPGNTKGRKSSRDDAVPQKLTKGSGDNTVKGKGGTHSSKKQQSATSGGEITNDMETSKEEQESAEYISAGRNIGTTVSDEGSDEKDELKEEEAKDDSGSESSRKDSELDLNVDSADRNDDSEPLFRTETLSVDIHERPTAERPDREPSPVSPAIFEMSKKMEASRKLWENSVAIGCPSNHGGAWEETLRASASVSSSIGGVAVVESAESRLSDDQVVVKKAQVELEANTSKNDSKSPDSFNVAKKTGSGEQQNVCKVKPQQQQQPPVKTQQSSSIVPRPAEENHQTELNTVPLGPPFLTQEHLLTQQAIQQRYAIPFVHPFVDAPQRQPFLQQQQLQQLQQTNQQVTPTFPIAHVQQVNQTRSSSSPLSQATQDIYQSPFLPGGVYSSGNFQGSQPYVSVSLLSSTTTQSLVTSAPRTQTTSLMGIQAQQPKPGSGSVFAQNVTPQGTQAMFMQYDPKTLRGGTPLFNIAQHPQSAQRQLLGAQPGIVGENLPRQAGFPAGQQTPQPFQGTYPFQQKQGTYDVSQDMQMKKAAEQSTDFNRQSELVKHVNAKPFEPPKRSTPGSVPHSSTSIGPLMSSTFARNPNLMTITQNPTDMGGSSQSPPVSTTLLSGRPVSMSPVEPGIPFPGAVGTFPKHTAINQFQLQQQPQGVQPQQFTPFQQQPVSLQQTLQIRAQGQQQQQGGNPLQGAGAAILPNPAVMAAAMPRQLIRAPSLGPIGIGGTQPSATNAQRFPSPIQRPVTASLMQGVPHMQAPRGPRAQTAPPPPPQMMPTKQQIVTNRPHLPAQSLPHPNPVAAAFKIEQHHKMLEQTKMFFAQQQGQHQQRVPLLSNQVDQQVKPVGSFQGDKPIAKGPVPRENLKFQEKKEETKSHISETNQRNRKPNSEQPNKTSKTTKVDTKPDESSKDKTIASKQDGKGPANKSSSLVRIQPLPPAARSRPNNRARGPPRMPGSLPATKPRISGRPEKEIKDTVQDQPTETPSPKSSNQAKTSEAQPVTPLSVNK